MTDQLISLSGDSGAGKDTIGDFLHNEFGYHRISWASNLRRTLAREFTDAPANYHQQGFVVADKNWEFSSGFLKRLIDLPLEVKRESRFQTLFEIQTLLHQKQRVVVVNSRLPQELIGVKVFGGELWYVDCDRCRRPRQSSDDWRFSWNGEYDRVIRNNGTVQELYSNVLLLAA